MERLMILLTEAVYDYGGDVSSRREVGVSSWYIITWSTYLGQHKCQAKYMIFSDFIISKTYTYYVFQMYIYYKRNTDGLRSHSSPTLSEKDLMINPWLLKEKRFIHKLYFIRNDDDLYPIILLF